MNERPLARGGDEVEQRRDRVGAAEPLEPGGGEDQRVGLAVASLRRRVSTLPRSSTTSTSGQRARSWAARRSELVPTRAPAPLQRRRAAERVDGVARGRGGEQREARRRARPGRPWRCARRGRPRRAAAPPRAPAPTRACRRPRGGGRRRSRSGRPRRAVEPRGDPLAPARAPARCRGWRSSPRAPARASGPRRARSPRPRSAGASASPNSSRASSSRACEPCSLSWSVGSCSRRAMTARAIASARAMSRGDALSHRPAFSASTLSTIVLAVRAQRARRSARRRASRATTAKRSISSSTISSPRAGLGLAAAQVARRRRAAGRPCRRASRPSSSPHAASTSRGTAMSSTSSGRPPRAAMTSSSSSRSTIGCGEAVAHSSTSACSSCSGSRSSGRTVPPKRSASERARAAWRLATKIVVTPLAASAWAVSSLVSPGADDHDGPAGEVAEHLGREVDGHRRHRRGAEPDPGLGAHALAGGQRGAEQAVRSAAGRPRARARPRRRA